MGKHTRVLISIAVSAFLAVAGAISWPLQPAHAQTPEQMAQELLELQDTLARSELDREKALADLSRLEAEIADTSAEIEAARRDVAESQSAIVHRKGRIKREAASLYRQPVGDVALMLTSNTLNEYVVSQKYLVDLLSDDAGALVSYRDAREQQQQLEASLLAQRRNLDAAVERKLKWQEIVDQSIIREQQMIGEIEKKLVLARQAQVLPWGTFPGCLLPETGVPGPHNLEDWAVWTLKTIAARGGLDPSVTVTREHIIALIAFAWGEGGGIQGHRGKYNPLNLNGWTRVFPELGGIRSGRGTDDWPSFDSGVEASARALTSRQYSRLRMQLADSTSSSEDFFLALAFPSAYAGNKNWSANDALHIGKYASLTARVRSNYAKYAGEPLRAAGQTLSGPVRAPSGASVTGVHGDMLACPAAVAEPPVEPLPE